MMITITILLIITIDVLPMMGNSIPVVNTKLPDDNDSLRSTFVLEYV